jgi:hypothetical protein
MLATCVSAADYLWPLPDSRTLTGGFADSRTDHFHGGVDLRARSPLRVVAPTDGWVERVGVNPPGYGRTLYFRLSDGNTAVFGHLSRYEPELQELVRDSQLVSGTYRVDFSFTDSTTAPRYKAGETLCFTGSSGRGPAHLHFEIRDGAVQLDPLQFYKPADRDKPVIVGVNWVKYSDNIPSSSGQSLALNVSPRVNSDEPIAFFIRTYDPGPWGRNAVPQAIRVYQGEQLIFEDRSAEIDLEGPQVIYEKLVYREFKHNDRDVRRLFDWFPLDLGENAPLPSGWIENFNGNVRIEVVDRNGNATSQTIDVNIGGTRRQPFVSALQTATTYHLSGDEVALSWANIAERYDECVIADEDFAFPAKLTLRSDVQFEPGKYWYKRSGAAGRSPMWRIPSDNPELMSCYVLRGGTYGVSIDDTPPILTLSGANGKLTFKLTDGESSIDDSSVRCEVDGETAIPEFEYEEGGGTIWTQAALRRGQHRVEFEAMNRAGLLKTWDVMVTIP